MQYLPASPYVRHGSGNSEEAFPAPAAFPLSPGYPFPFDHGLVPASNFYFPAYLSHPLPLAQGDPLAGLTTSLESMSLQQPPAPALGGPSYQAEQGWRPPARGRGSGEGASRRRNNTDARQRQYAEAVKRTVYICDIDPQVTEAQLAELFADCGSIMDCRVCGDPHTAMRFAFIEFENEGAVNKAIALTGRPVGNFSLRVRPSKTAIVPVNNGYLPRTDEEHQLCARTVYAANIDKKVDKVKVRQFFENLCGPVSRLRLLGDSHHATRIAFVEFCKAESAEMALSCSGALLGSLPVRLAPSKTPVRPDPRSDS